MVPGTFDDVDHAAACGVGAVHLSFPISSIHLAAMGKEEGWLVDRIAETVVYARRKFDYVSVGAQDASRADPGLLARTARIARCTGPTAFVSPIRWVFGTLFKCRKPSLASNAPCTG